MRCRSPWSWPPFASACCRRVSSWRASTTDQSLLTTERGRIDMLQFVRLFAAETLLDPASAHRRHASWYAQRDPRVEELDNLVAACRRSVALGDWSAATLTFHRAGVILTRTGPLSALICLGEPLINQGPHALSQAKIQIATRLISAQMALGDIDDAYRLLRLARSWQDANGDANSRVSLLYAESYILERRGDVRGGIQALDAARVLAENMPGKWMAALLGAGAVLHFQLGEFDEARSLWEQVLERGRRAGRHHEVAVVLANLAGLDHRQGNLERAIGRLEETFVVAAEIGDVRTQARVIA
jgi:tetratricopeptide (TPR) repeat protein